MHRIVKKKIKLDDITHFGFNLSTSHEKYPLEKLSKSIQDNGWDPTYPELPYHRDNCRFSQCFLAKHNKDNKYGLGNGKHRYLSLKQLGKQEIEAYVLYANYPSGFSKSEMTLKIKQLEHELTGTGMYQSFEFPYDLFLKMRDDSRGIFYSTEWEKEFYVNKNVLDIACNGGYFAIESKKNGANKVVGFDAEPYLIDKAKRFRDLIEVNVGFKVSNFWNYNFDQQYDIVFCNQCIYHFANTRFAPYNGRGSDAIPEVLDRICDITNNYLVMFTFVNFKDPDYCDFHDGYKPGFRRMERDLLERGFKEVRIYHHEGAKRTVVASKQPWEYIWPLYSDSNYLVYKSPHINYSKLKNWNTLNKDDIIDCY